jgi:carbamoyl-phosphate synthase large subunit
MCTCCPLMLKVLKKYYIERQIDAVLPTMGGQTALNLCIEVDERAYGKNMVLKL